MASWSIVFLHASLCTFTALLWLCTAFILFALSHARYEKVAVQGLAVKDQAASIRRLRCEVEELREGDGKCWVRQRIYLNHMRPRTGKIDQWINHTNNDVHGGDVRPISDLGSWFVRGRAWTDGTLLRIPLWLRRWTRRTCLPTSRPCALVDVHADMDNGEDHHPLVSMVPIRSMERIETVVRFVTDAYDRGADLGPPLQQAVDLLDDLYERYYEISDAKFRTRYLDPSPRS